jgi:hypothetical protein
MFNSRPIAPLILLTLLVTTLPSTAAVKVEPIEYLKWPHAWRVSNPSCQLVVVPDVGRVMCFARTGGKNILYNNEELAGQTVLHDDHEWHNFGGDKVWPTEQDWWIRYTDRKGWPPPYFSDAAPQTAEAITDGVRMISPPSPEFGTRTIREFVMDPDKPLVHVRQHFVKDEGKPVVMSLWTVTQVRTPDYAMIPLGKPFDGKPFRMLSPDAPNAQALQDVAVIRVNPKAPQKIGSEPSEPNGDRWVAAVIGEDLFVESRSRSKDKDYPDRNCAQEIFTADAPLKEYVELELLSRLTELKTGETLADDATWQLTQLDPTQAADPSKAAVAVRSLIAHADGADR